MRILLDENLPTDLIGILRALGHDVEHVYSKALSGHPDRDIRALADAEDRLLVTQDIRFADARHFTPGTHPGFVLVRLEQNGLRAIVARVESVFRTENVESWRGCIVVIRKNKVRVRRGDR